MSSSLDVLRKRRSIRKYQARPVSQELIKEVLEAAGWAPSAHNAQPWRFIVLTDSQVKKRLAEAMSKVWVADMVKDGVSIEPEKFKFRVKRFAEAPVLILACLTMEDMKKQADEQRQRCERNLALQSLAASLQNLLLAAHAKGLGACWYCAPAFCKETVRKTLKIPFEVDPEALITMGYPSEKPSAQSRKELCDYCFQDIWGAKYS
jgi:coenzyme F420-0:L-glutamate ligase / coenzyme F420-1:gamma-L-glutamate ligase